MKEYEVLRPWHGAKAGEKFKAEQLHPALKSHVREVFSQLDDNLTPTTLGTSKRGRQNKPEAEY